MTIRQRVSRAWAALFGDESRLRQRSSLRASNFTGASVSRLTRDLTGASLLSADQEVIGEIAVLRARARKLVRNNPHASGFVNEFKNNVVGPEGIRLQGKVRTVSGVLVEKVNDELERGWKEWGYPENCSADTHDSWVDLEGLIAKTLPTDGEVFIRRLQYFDNAHGYAIQIVDADLVDEMYNIPAKQGQNEIRMGVEVDQWNRPVAYHIWDRHPSEVLRRKRQRIAASEITHLFIRYRPNQTRGITWFAPVLLDLHMLDGYEEAELMGARAAASAMGFILNNNADAIAAYQPAKEGEAPKVFDVEPLTLAELGPGQTVAEFNPNRPAPAFKEFEKAVLRSIARGLNMAYTTLTGDLEAVNYSSIRAGLLSERDHYKALQRWLSCHLHRVVYREWVSMALLSGAISLDSRLASDYADAVEWQPRGWQWVDPVNDLTAIEKAIKLGLTTRAKEAAAKGTDYEENVDQLAHETEYAEAAGVDVDGTEGQKATMPGDDDESPAREEKDDDTKQEARRLAVA